MATVRSRELLAKLKLSLKDLYLILRERESFAGLDFLSILLVQPEQNVIYRLIEGKREPGREKTDAIFFVRDVNTLRLCDLHFVTHYKSCNVISLTTKSHMILESNLYDKS